LAIVLDSNVHIPESKAATCDIRPGRRPRGAALSSYVAEYQRRGHVRTHSEDVPDTPNA
jgi:formate dehydrogenase major subunit